MQKSNVSGTVSGTSATTLVNSFGTATSSRSSLSAWKRRVTIYCNARAAQTGGSPKRYRAAIKAALTKAGYDSSDV